MKLTRRLVLHARMQGGALYRHDYDNPLRVPQHH